MNRTLDHVMFAWRDLEDIRETFSQIGLPPTYGGVHEDQPTEMAMLGFEDGSYLELLAPTDPENPPEEWPETMFAAGPCRWCLHVDDLRRELDRLDELGASIRGPVESSRERPDGTLVEYEEAVYGTEGTFWRLPFLVRDQTPRHNRVLTSERAEGSSLTGISQIVIAVEDLNEAIDQFRALHSYPAPQRAAIESFEATLASFPDQPVVLAEPLNDRSWIATRLENHPEGPCSVLLESSDFSKSATEFPMTGSTEWFTSQVGWFDVPELEHWVGIIER